MAIENGISYVEMDDQWDVNEAAGVYNSRSAEGQQRLVFNKPFRDGKIATEITIRESSAATTGSEPMWASIIFRYQDRNHYYHAGIGGHEARYFIGKMVDGQSQALVIAGKRASIEKGIPYKIQVHCVGNQMSLAHNGIKQLSVFDNAFNSGPCGFHTWRTVAEFKGLSWEAVKPTCFVIMPFASEFDEVYQVIRETVENHRFECVRADQRYLSGPIIEDVLDRIERADLIVADFTGKNANVFYEAGYAKALRKPVVQIAQSVGDLPFDVRHLRTFSYNTKILGDRKLAHDLGEAIKATTGFDPAPSHNGHSST